MIAEALQRTDLSDTWGEAMRGVLFWIVLVGAAASNKPDTSRNPSVRDNSQASYDRAGVRAEREDPTKSDDAQTAGKGKGRAFRPDKDEQRAGTSYHDTDTRRFFVALVVKVGFLLGEQDGQAVLGMLERFVDVQGYLGRN